MKNKNAILGGLAAVILIAAGYRFVIFAGSGAGLPGEYAASAVCLACQDEAAVTARIVDRPPYACPKCESEAVYPWWYCMQCNVRFVPELVRRAGEPPRMPAIPACPQCGQNQTAAWLPDDESQAAEGDLPLPKWP